MKKAAKVFLILGIIYAVLVAGLGVVFMFYGNLIHQYLPEVEAELAFLGSEPFKMMAIICFAEAGYTLVLSIVDLILVEGKSKAALIVFGILTLPVNLLAGIFMLCIRVPKKEAAPEAPAEEPAPAPEAAPAPVAEPAPAPAPKAEAPKAAPKKFRCSKCKNVFMDRPERCPHCGAKMKYRN